MTSGAVRWARQSQQILSMMDGVFAVNKPRGISSAQALRDLERHFRNSELFGGHLERERQQRASEDKQQHRRRSRAKRELRVKLGHGGTLDPEATGVLIVGVGRGTKDLSLFLGGRKSYEATALFGAATDTYDGVGAVVARRPVDGVTKDVVRDALARFRGRGKQTPPIFSALRIDGKRLYEYARSGEPLPREIEQRDVEVFELQLLRWMEAGEHRYGWPERVAGKMERDLVKDVFGLQASSPSPTPDEQTGEVAVSTDVATEPTAELAAEARTEENAKAEQPSESTANADAASKRSKKRKRKPSPSLPAPQPSQPRSPAPAPAALIRMTVSSGYYVRSFVHDLGQAVGSVALMASLTRTEQGTFSLSESGTEEPNDNAEPSNGDNNAAVSSNGKDAKSSGSRPLEWAELEHAGGEKVWGPRVQAMLSEWHAWRRDAVVAKAAREGARTQGEDVAGDEAGSPAL